MDVRPGVTWHLTGARLVALVVAALAVGSLLRQVAGTFVDLDVYRWGGGVLLAHDGALYSVSDVRWHLSFTYPPVAALLFAPLHALPFGLLAHAMVAVSLAALARTTWLLVRAGGRGDPVVVSALVLAVATFAQPVTATLWLGQVDLLLVWLVVEDLLGAWPRRWQGVLTGLAAAVKLTPLAIVVFLAASGGRRTAGRALATMAVSVVVPALLRPRDVWDFWTSAVWQPRRAGPVYSWLNQSVVAVVSRLSHHAAGRGVWELIAVVVLLAGLAVAARLHRRGDTLLALGVAVTTMLLASPISWDHHWVWALVPGVTAWAVDTRGSRWVVAGLLVVTLTGMIRWPFLAHRNELHWGIWQQLVGNSYVWWGLAFLCWAGWRASRPPLPRPSEAPAVAVGEVTVG